MTDTMIAPIAQQVLDCFCAALITEHGVATMLEGGTRPSQCCYRPGELASMDASLYEDLCCSGLAWVRVTDMFSSSTDFPTPDTLNVWTGCGPMAWGVVFELGVMRCAPTGSVAAVPTCEEWMALQANIFKDAKAMRTAMCCLKNLYDPGSLAIGSWEPLPTTGGCAGSTWELTVQVLNTESCC